MEFLMETFFFFFLRCGCVPGIMYVTDHYADGAELGMICMPDIQLIAIYHMM